MKKFFLSLWGKIVDHILGIFLTTIITTPFILEIFTKIKPVTRLVVPFLLWQWSGWIALVIILVVLWIRNKIEKRKEMLERSGQMGVPVIFIGEEMIIGFNKPRIVELLGL